MPQHPIGSGFGPATTADEVIAGIDLSGRAAIVTGGYSGLGRETARVFAEAGARVIVPARDVRRAEEALAGIAAEVRPMDLMDPASIDAFADHFLTDGEPLHILVNSAGIMAAPLSRDAHGHESHFATNHLGHFWLTARLMPALRSAVGARVVSVSSFGHRYSDVIFDDIDFRDRPYDPWAGYGQSKTANILFAVALDAREAENGVRAFSAHPGSIAGTGLEKHVPRRMLIEAGVLTADGAAVLDPARNLKSVPQGAATQVWCAVSPALEGMGGLYCENVGVAPVSDFAKERSDMADSLVQGGVMPYAIDPDAAERLWRMSVAMMAP